MKGFSWPALFLVIISISVKSEVLFQEDFNAQPDYVSNHNVALLYEYDLEKIPDQWYAVRQSSDWDPTNGDAENHETIEILSSNADKAKGGKGKSLVVYRESYNKGSDNWVSEGLMMKYFPQGFDELFVSFWIRFSDQWTKTAGWTSKVFRIYAWNPSDSSITKYFEDGGSGPIALWDYSVTNYGVRNRWSLRGGPYGDNYSMVSNISGFPRVLGGLGDTSLNFTVDTIGQAEDGSTPKIPDLVKGGYISDDMNQTVHHDQIFGLSGSWTKLSFYVKMNSAPGVNDGVLKQWINDELVLKNFNIPWVGPKPWEEATTPQTMPKWNVVGFGGNSYFGEYDVSEKYEEWYSIDDIIISTNDQVSRPLPPTNVSVEKR